MFKAGYCIVKRKKISYFIVELIAIYMKVKVIYVRYWSIRKKKVKIITITMKNNYIIFLQHSTNTVFVIII